MTDTTRHPLDQATAVVFDGSACQGHTNDRYWAFVGPFGGATAATILRSVLEQAHRIGDPLAITLNFCAPLQRGAFDLDVREVKTNRSTQHWTVQLSQPGAGVAVSASVVLAVRRESWSHQSAAAPELPSPEDLPEFVPTQTVPWVDRYSFRFAAGEPAGPIDERGSLRGARSQVWISDREPRPIDALSLVAMSDAFFGRIFLVRGLICPFGTVSMTVYFHASADELSLEGGQSIFGVADAHVFHRGYADQTGELWSVTGRLLATTQQIAYFKL
ncbi:MAG: thioesterase family protein [Burkholderiales bacterium]